VIASIRADEACHRETNHFLASVYQDLEIPEENINVINSENEKKKFMKEKIKKE
jgi:hypothetical protein